MFCLRESTEEKAIEGKIRDASLFMITPVDSPSSILLDCYFSIKKVFLRKVLIFSCLEMKLMPNIL